MEFQVRAMHSDDLDSVYAIEVAAHRAPWSRIIFRDCLLVGYDCRVLELGHKDIVGYIMCRHEDKIVHVLNLCVAPAEQHKGYGRLLLQNMLDSLTNTRINTILLEVRPSNQPALSLYRKLGFKEVGIKKDYYSDQYGVEDAVVLQKTRLSLMR